MWPFHAFAELLGRVDAVPGIERIRYTSPHPKDMREDVIRAHAELPALCEHIHLPLQSGSSRVLKAMRRTYNRARYLDVRTGRFWGMDTDEGDVESPLSLQKCGFRAKAIRVPG